MHWSLAPAGVVLHNFVHRRLIEMDKAGYYAWGFLDGARTVDEVVQRSIERLAPRPRARLTVARDLRILIDTLLENGFIEARES